MKSPVLSGVGVLMILLGVLWALQGLGYIGGSVMSGVTLWAIVGPIVALAGVAVILLGRRRT